MLHALFEANDIEVCEAENGEEGVQKAQELNPGLVILILSMPVMNGTRRGSGFGRGSSHGANGNLFYCGKRAKRGDGIGGSGGDEAEG